MHKWDSYVALHLDGLQCDTFLGQPPKMPCCRINGSFAATLLSQSFEIHNVFLQLSLLDLRQNLSLTDNIAFSSAVHRRNYL